MTNASVPETHDQTHNGFPTDAPYDKRQILQWLLFLRVVVATFVLGTVFLIEHPEVRYAFYTLIGVHVLTALLSALFIQRMAQSEWFLMTQVYWDILFVSGLVYITGGYFSFFLFMYVIAVINASILLSRRSAITSAFICTAVLIYLFYAQWKGDLLVPNSDFGLPPMSLRDVVNKIALNVFAIFVATYLTGYLSDRSKQVSHELEKKRDDLVKLRERFEHIVRSIPIGLMTLNESDQVEFANNEARGIFSGVEGGIEGRSFRDLLPNMPSMPMISSGKPVAVKYARNGKPLFLEVSQSPMEMSDDSAKGSLVVIEDRTKLITMEEAVKRSDKMAAVGQLAAGIAHELRNPLASISGSIQLLYKELDLKAVDRQLMGIVMRETERLNDLVTDFLAFARSETPTDCVVDARLLIEEVMKVLANEPNCRDAITIRQNVEDRLFIRIDPKALRQLLWNLGTNAVQAMPDGGTLTVSGRVLAGVEGFESKVVEIAVTDTGIGIDEETKKSVFNPFFTTKEGGTGLGLTACHNIVEMCDGRIMVESSPGQGASFIVQLPAAERAGVAPNRDKAE